MGGRALLHAHRGVAQRMPLAAIKGANTSRSGTSKSNDPDLQLDVEANCDYEFEMYLVTWGDHAPGDLNFQMNGPSGSTLYYTFPHDEGGGVTDYNNVHKLGVGVKIATYTNSVDSAMCAHARGWLTVGSTAGTFTMSWGADTSGGSGTVVGKGSRILLRKISP
jgi:hypothetical protein